MDAENTLEFQAEVRTIAELEKLYREVSVPVWRTEDAVSSASYISTVVVLITLCSTHGILNEITVAKAELLSNIVLHCKNSCSENGS
jgi:hypothetical protein